MKLVLIAAVPGMVALLSGCPPVMTIEPLYQLGQEKQKVDDPGLIGEGIPYEGFLSLDVSQGDKVNDRYWREFGVKASSPGQSSSYLAVLVQLGNRQFLDVAPQATKHEIVKMSHNAFALHTC